MFRDIFTGEAKVRRPTLLCVFSRGELRVITSRNASQRSRAMVKEFTFSPTGETIARTRVSVDCTRKNMWLFFRQTGKGICRVGN